MELILAVLLMAGGSLASFAVDLKRSVEQASSKGGEEAMAAVARAHALADLLAIAVLADGVVTDEEWARLRAAIQEGGHDVDAEQAVARLRMRAGNLGDPATLRARIRGIAASLGAEDRASVMRAVADFVQAGSGSASIVQSYRTSAHSDPDALLRAFAEGLGVPVPARIPAPAP